MSLKRLSEAETIVCRSAKSTVDLARSLGQSLAAGDAVLLSGRVGAGKTIFTSGVAAGLGFDPREVSSPSFTLVNLYRSPRADIYHIDFWRIDQSINPAFAVDLDGITNDDRAVLIIEWPEALGEYRFRGRVFRVKIEGDGDGPRNITIKSDAADA